MFLNDNQRAKVCSGLLAWAGLERLWSISGPTDEALALMAQCGGALSGGEYVMLRLAFALWNNNEKLSVADLVGRIDADRLNAVGSLFIALSKGTATNALTEWIAENQRALIASGKLRVRSTISVV